MITDNITISLVQDTLATWTGVGAAIATLIVALLTLFNVIIAKNSLKLMQSKEKRWEPQTELYLVDSRLKRNISDRIRIYAICIKISNQSDSSNSIKTTELLIKYRRNQDIVSNILVPSTLVTNIEMQELLRHTDDLIVVPKHMNAHEVIRGWIFFKINEEIIRESTIDSYTLKIVDVHNVESSLAIGIFYSADDE